MMHGTVSPQNSYVKALILTVTIFGNIADKEVIKVKCVHKGEALT